MKISSSCLAGNQPVPKDYAFGIIDPEQHVGLSSNRNPHLAWSDVPAGTRSFVVMCHDIDVPSKPDDVNKEDREVPADLPRVDFYHWLLWNIPAEQREIAEGAHSDGVTPKGKAGPDAPNGLQHGRNTFTDWFSGDADMAGDYFGYDGPCPPWNDSILHRYIFTVYALDCETLQVEGDLKGDDLKAAMKNHVLDSAEMTLTYTLNPRLAG